MRLQAHYCKDGIYVTADVGCPLCRDEVLPNKKEQQWDTDTKKIGPSSLTLVESPRSERQAAETLGTSPAPTVAKIIA